MIPGFESIVEERIKQAQKEGQFDNLQGKFKPLTFEPYQGPEEMRMAHKILKNAGFLPPEVELRKKISETEQLLDTVQMDLSERHHTERRLRYLWTKLESIRQNRSGLSVFYETYSRAIEKKLL